MIKFADSFPKKIKLLVVGIGGSSKDVIDTLTASYESKELKTAFIDTKVIKELEHFVDSLPAAEIVFTITGLGGTTGTVITPYVLDLLKKKNYWIWSLLTLPFFFEGKQKIVSSLKGMKGIQKLADGMLIIPHDKVFKLTDKSVQMFKAFHPANEICIKLITGIDRLTSSSGRIKTGVSDIKKRMSDKHITAFGTGTAEGENRIDEAIGIAALDVLLGREILAKTKNLLVSVMAGDDLKLKEVEAGMKSLKPFLPKGSNIAFGITTNKEWTGRVEVDMIALGLESAVSDMSDNWNVSLDKKDETQNTQAEKIELQLTSTKTRIPKHITKAKQTTIDFRSSFKGRFDKSNPTLHHGEDLDIPTFLRKKKALIEN